jgi:hypothetical protein
MVQQTLPEKPQMSQKRHLPKINKHPDQTQGVHQGSNSDTCIATTLCILTRQRARWCSQIEATREDLELLRPVNRPTCNVFAGATRPSERSESAAAGRAGGSQPKVVA